MRSIVQRMLLMAVALVMLTSLGVAKEALESVRDRYAAGAAYGSGTTHSPWV